MWERPINSVGHEIWHNEDQVEMSMKVGGNRFIGSSLKHTALSRLNSYGCVGRWKNKDHCEVTTDEFGQQWW